MTTPKLSVDDPEFLDKIIFEVKSQGHFDMFRKECLADVDTQPAFQNLHSRVEDSVQKFLNRQVWTPETNKNKLREEMRHNIVRAGYLDNGVSRIVDQVVEQKMDYIHSKVEEILYSYVGIAKPIKKEKPNGALEVETDLLPTDLEQVSPDILEEIKDEEIEEEIVEDEDFESPAFEPIEPMAVDKNENSNLSAISGLTSQDSLENKSDPTNVEPEQVQPDTQLSQISSTQEQDISQEEAQETVPITAMSSDDAQMATNLDEKQEAPAAEEPEKSQFDLKKDSIEFTGTERKSMQLDDSTTSGDADKSAEAVKILQPQDVPSNTMEIDNLYENDTTDSSEIHMRMEIDLKDETTQETAESSKVEDSSQDSTVPSKETRHHHKSDRSRDKQKSSSSHRSSRHTHSSTSKSRHDDKYKSRSGGKSRSSSHKKSTTDKDRSRRDHDKDKRPKDEPSRSKHREPKTDDHQQEKSSSRRRSTDHDSNEGKGVGGKPGTSGENATKTTQAMDQTEPISKSQESDNKPTVVDKMLNENGEISFESKSSTSSNTRKEAKSSILIKYDYLKAPTKSESQPAEEENEDECIGFAAEKLPENPWFECLRNEVAQPKAGSSYAEQKKLDGSLSLHLSKSKSKAKTKNVDSPDSPNALLNGSEQLTQEVRAQTIAQQQRYTSDDLYKPRFDFGNRSRRRGQVTEENTNDEKVQQVQS